MKIRQNLERRLLAFWSRSAPSVVCLSWNMLKTLPGTVQLQLPELVTFPPGFWLCEAVNSINILLILKTSFY